MSLSIIMASVAATVVGDVVAYFIIKWLDR